MSQVTSRRSFIWALALASLAQLHCSAEQDSPPTENIEHRHVAIINGTLVTDAAAPYLPTENGCSGTLVTPEWVLTAAHCYSSFGGGQPVKAFGQTSYSDFTLFHPRGNMIWSELIEGGTSIKDVDAVLLHIDPPINLNQPDAVMSALDTDTIANDQLVKCFGQGGDGILRYASFRTKADTCRDPDVHFETIEPNGNDQETTFGDSGGACWIWNPNQFDWKLAGITEGFPPECSGRHRSKISAEAFRSWVSYVTSRPASGSDPRVYSTGKCSSTNKCQAYQGDCDGNGECYAPLFCAANLGPAVGLASDVDVCKAPANDGCPTFDAANPSTSFCTEACPCGLGEGDCDNDAQCRGMLICRSAFGSSVGLPPNYDVCTLPF